MTRVAEMVRSRWRRRPFTWPIVLGIVMSALLAAIIVGWVILTVRHATAEREIAGVYWTILSVGTTFLVMVLVGVGLYLALSLKAIALNRRQSNFIDSVTHELKSPIASLKLYLQTLGRRNVSDEERAEFHRIMLENVAQLDELIDHMLEAARLDRTSGDTQLEEVALVPVLTKTAASVCARYHVPAETIRIEAEPVVVRGARLAVELIVGNLMDNAVKYAGAQPSVLVEAREGRNGRVVVRVHDNGRTIPARQRRRIFGRFVRLGSELEREEAGTGLGLYIVRTLVRGMRGRVVVSDRGRQRGNTFEVRLPGQRAETGESGAGSLSRAQAGHP